MQLYLNEANIARSTNQAEYHPLKPCLDSDTKVLFLGSFPPPLKKWSKGFNFFYPNFINDHWRIMGIIFYNNKDHFVDTLNKTFYYNKVLSFTQKFHIGYYDTAQVVKRLKDNASDKFLEIVEETNIIKLLAKAPNCTHIITTGEKATQTICNTMHIETFPKIGQDIAHPIQIDDKARNVILHRLPSSSRAYPLSIEKKANMYRNTLLNILQSDIP